MRRNEDPGEFEDETGSDAKPSIKSGSGLATQRIFVAAFPLSLLVMINIFTLARQKWFLFDNMLLGPDAYMRLVRVREFAEHLNWYDQLTRATNTPFGEVLHWSRPLDVLLLAGAALFSPLAGFDAALFWWGALINPLAHVLALLILLWAAEKLFPPPGRVYLGVLFLTQFFINFQFSLGRPDHHGLIALSLVALIALSFRLLQPGNDDRAALAAGLTAAMGLWISIEGLLGAGAVLLALGIAWIAYGENFARKTLLYCASLCFGLALAIPLEYPPGQWLMPVYDAVSIVHLFIFSLIALFWLIAWRFGDTAGTVGRISFCIIGGSVFLLALWLVFPKFLDGPMVDVHPRVIEEWFKNNAEVGGLLRLNAFAETFPNFAGHMLPVLLAIPASIYLIVTGGPVERRLWLFLLIGILVTLPVATLEQRWTGHAQLFAVFSYTAMALSLVDKWGKLPLLPRAFARAGTIIVFAVGPLLLTVALKMSQAKIDDQDLAACKIKAVAEFLQNRYPQPKNIMSMIFLGPQLAYHSRHRVVASPYHRNAAGILASYDFIGARDLNKAKAMAHERQLDLLLICPRDAEALRFKYDKQSNLFQQLMKNELPSWLTAVQLPKELRGTARLYEIHLQR